MADVDPQVSLLDFLAVCVEAAAAAAAGGEGAVAADAPDGDKRGHGRRKGGGAGM